MPVVEFSDDDKAKRLHPCGYEYGDCGGVCDGCGDNPEMEEESFVDAFREDDMDAFNRAQRRSRDADERGCWNRDRMKDER